VGVVGHSRGGWLAYYLATHRGRVRPGAYISDDAMTGDFGEHLRDGAGGILSNTFRIAGSTFWQNRAVWLQEDTTFNASLIDAPMLMTEHYVDAAGNYSDRSVQTIGAFMHTRRPLEYLYFPVGSHHLQRPRERLALLDASVDWFSFWLLNQEDSDPRKQEQYSRWRDLRSQWSSQQAWEARGHPVGDEPH
jgi:hypothetical protein